MRGMGCAACVEEKRHAYTILVRKSQGYNKTKKTTHYYVDLISVNILIFVFLVTIVWVLL
jgi:hypothetical protein